MRFSDSNSEPTSESERSDANGNARRTAKGQSASQSRHARLTVCIHNGPLPNCMSSSATRQSFQDHKLSRSMQIIPQKPVLSVGIPPMRTVHTKGCSLSVRTRTVGTRCTLIWLARGILPCERSYFGKTGVRRAPCHCTLMHRTTKPKQCACKGTLSCGGVQM